VCEDSRWGRRGAAGHCGGGRQRGWCEWSGDGVRCGAYGYGRKRPRVKEKATHEEIRKEDGKKEREKRKGKGKEKEKGKGKGKKEIDCLFLEIMICKL
jgi:hypothetical protein